MSVFRKHKSIVDRAASDRTRHKKKIDKAIKESIKDVVAEESIIGQNGKKKIRIPVRGIKEYRFVYGNNENNKSVGSGGGHNVKRGQKIGKKRAEKGQGQGTGKASDKKGEEYSWNFWTKESRDKFVEETKEFTRAERKSHWKMYYEQKR